MFVRAGRGHIMLIQYFHNASLPCDLYLDHNFQTRKVRVFILDMCISCDLIFSLKESAYLL